MAKTSKKRRGAVTKKHLARVEREKRQSQAILIASVVIIGLVVIIVGYGILDQLLFQGWRTVATVNGEKISVNQFQGLARYSRYNLIRNAMNTYQFAQMFGSDPTTLASFASQVQQIQRQMDPYAVGEQTVDQLVNDRLIRQEAEKMSIVVTEEEVDKAMQNAFGYFADGTPTPTSTFVVGPTSTLSSQQLTLIPPTATATITPTLTATATPSQTVTAPTATATATATTPPTATQIPTPEATATESPTPTPFTEEAFNQLYADTIASFDEEYQIDEKTIRFVIEAEAYRLKMVEAITGDLPCEQEQVWALHILVSDEALAKDILERLEAGEEWGALAVAYSTDTSNKDKGGDLGWFGPGAMVAEFEEAAFALDIGETSEPVQSQFGWHIIRVLGHENRPLDGEACLQMKAQKFQDWLDEVRESSEIDIKDTWIDHSPQEPNLPDELIAWMSEILSTQPQEPGTFPVVP